MSTLAFRTVERDSFFTRLDFRPKLFMIAIITVINSLHNFSSSEVSSLQRRYKQ